MQLRIHRQSKNAQACAFARALALAFARAAILREASCKQASGDNVRAAFSKRRACRAACASWSACNFASAAVAAASFFAAASLASFGWIHILNAQDPELRESAWDFFATTLRMFGALMIFSMVDKLTTVLMALILPEAFEDDFIKAGVYLAPAILSTFALQAFGPLCP